MSFADTLTVDDASGDDTVFVLITRDGTGTTRLDQSTSSALPGILNIRHSVNGKGSAAIDQHLVQGKFLIDADPEPVELKINITWYVPRNSAVTSGIVLDRTANLLDLISDGSLTSLTGTFVSALLQGQS